MYLQLRVEAESKNDMMTQICAGKCKNQAILNTGTQKTKLENDERYS